MSGQDDDGDNAGSTPQQEPDEFTPANDLEADLYNALVRQDFEEYLRRLVEAELYLPITVGAGEGREPVSWSLVVVDGHVCLPAFTSPEALVEGTRGQGKYFRTTTFRQLAAAWPDMTYVLLVNPLSQIQSRIVASDLIRLAAFDVVDAINHPGDSENTARSSVMEKVMTGREALRFLQQNQNLVSGYVFRLEETTHFSTFDSHLANLHLQWLNPGIRPSSTVIYLVRWIVVGAALYRQAYGGADFDQMNSANGWIIDEEPFRGTGFIADAQSPVQLYRVHALRLPHGSELIQITKKDPAGTVLAYYDADLRSWAWEPGVIDTIRAEAAR